MWNKAEAEEPYSPIQSPPVEPEPINPAPQTVREKSLIGKTLHIKGDLAGEEDLFIEGSVDGNIQLSQHNVTVGANGNVHADIYANRIIIAGNVEGNLFGADQLVLRKSSVVRGNITAPRVILEDGSNFKGSIDMSSEKSSEEPAEILKSLDQRQIEGGAVNPGHAAPQMDIAEM